MAEQTKVFFIYGNDSVAIEIYIRKILADAEKKTGQTFNVHSYDAGVMPVNDILLIADSQSLLPAPLAHIFRNPSVLLPKGKSPRATKKEQERFLAYLANPNSDSLLVITAEIDKKLNAFQKKVMEVCHSFRADQPEGKDLSKILDELAEKHKKNWSVRAKQALMQLQSRLDLGRILQEGEKILLYSDGPEVSEEDVQTMLAPLAELSIFNLLDAVFEGKGPRSLQAWRDCQAQGETAGKIIYMLSDQARRLILLKSMQGQGARISEMQKVAGRPAFVVKKNLGQIHHIPMDRLIAALDLILEKDYERKHSFVDDDRELIDRLLIRLFATLYPQSSIKP